MVNFSLYKWILRKAKRQPIKFIACFLVIIYFICIIIIMRYENVSILEALLRILPSILGDIGSVETNPTGIASILALAVYICFLGMVFGKISDVLINISLKGGLVMKKVNYKNHIVICGWNYQGQKIIEDLLCSYMKKPIVILADMEKVPYDSDKVDFVRGYPWKKEDLIRAGIPKADTAIILTDITSKKTTNPDADALMITLSIESLNRGVHTCVQLLSSENKIHLENANADEIICLDQIGGSLTVFSALNHGVSRVVSELMNFDRGSEFYRCKQKIPNNYIGKSFREIGKQLLDKKMILIAIETTKDGYILKECSNDWIHSSGEGRVMLINPQVEYKLRENDNLFIISESEPTDL